MFAFFIFAFMITGLVWTGVWGAKFNSRSPRCGHRRLRLLRRGRGALGDARRDAQRAVALAVRQPAGHTALAAPVTGPDVVGTAANDGGRLSWAPGTPAPHGRRHPQRPAGARAPAASTCSRRPRTIRRRAGSPASGTTPTARPTAVPPTSAAPTWTSTAVRSSRPSASVTRPLGPGRRVGHRPARGPGLGHLEPADRAGRHALAAGVGGVVAGDVAQAPAEGRRFAAQGTGPPHRLRDPGGDRRPGHRVPAARPVDGLHPRARVLRPAPGQAGGAGVRLHRAGQAPDQRVGAGVGAGTTDRTGESDAPSRWRRRRRARSG